MKSLHLVTLTRTETYGVVAEDADEAKATAHEWWFMENAKPEMVDVSADGSTVATDVRRES